MGFTMTLAKQLPLFHCINQDDAILRNSNSAKWYHILDDFKWQSYRTIAATYYDALYDFNQKQVQKNDDNTEMNDDIPSAVDKHEAKQLFLAMRMTEDKTSPILFEAKTRDAHVKKTDPLSIEPGVVPIRFVGRKPKCFFALFKAFIGTSLMGFSPEPEHVFDLLQSNLSFARVCGFLPKESDNDPYWHKHVPSLRKLEQFDQIMTEYGIWSTQKWKEVISNIEQGVIEKENELVGDTTHYHAYSGFETVSYTDDSGKEQKKSQSKLTKTCSCSDKETCHHPWKLIDEGAGTIVKAHKKMYWGHKASVLGLPKQGIPLDVKAVSEASTYDGKTFLPHVKELFKKIPKLIGWIGRVLYDSACDDKDLKKEFKEELNIKLLASQNPRRKKPITEGLPKGIHQIAPSGTITCWEKHSMDYKGIRWESEQFTYGPPLNDDGQPQCSTCKFKWLCCPKAENGRHVSIPFDLMPQIDPEDPPMSKRFKAIMTRRPSVERMIKRIKKDMSDDRLSKRGNASFQANLDKTMIAFHILLRE